MSISVLILTLNEEGNLPGCLASVGWSDDVMVLDSGSTDRTVEIARAGGARVLERRFDDFASQRNHGMEHGGFRHEWVLHLDADERVPPALEAEMTERVDGAAVDAFEVASRVFFGGAWLRHAGMYPCYQVRLGRRDRLRFVPAGHGQREALPRDRVGRLKQALAHYPFSRGPAEWFARHNRYSSEEAAAALAARGGARAIGSALAGLVDRDPVCRRRAAKTLSYRLPFRGPLRFLYMYGFRLGFLDGRAGLLYCRLLALYECMVELKLAESRWRERRGEDHPG